jgi:hypothetical protein
MVIEVSESILLTCHLFGTGPDRRFHHSNVDEDMLEHFVMEWCVVLWLWLRAIPELTCQKGDSRVTPVFSLDFLTASGFDANIPAGELLFQHR